MCRLRSPVFVAQVLARQLLEGRVGGVRLQGGVQARPSLVSRVWEGGEGGRCQRSCFACAHALPALTSACCLGSSADLLGLGVFKVIAIRSLRAPLLRHLEYGQCSSFA